MPDAITFLLAVPILNPITNNGADIGHAEAVTVPQAILLYTGRARTLAPLDGVGLISPGQEGSFIVLDRDIFTIPAEEIDEVQVSETYIQGDRVYERGSSNKQFCC